MRLTDRSVVRQLCEKYGFSLFKGFGQNFLVNPGVCPRLCEAAGLTPEDAVLEIGPGFGTLTQELAQRAGKVLSLEVDRRLLPVLGETLADFPNVKVVQGDVMKADLAGLIQQELGGCAKVCANLPYNLTSPILMRLLEEKLPVSRITVMVQKEAAQRITATPGTREVGAITYAVHYYSIPKMAFTVRPGSFYPPPKVTSAVITLDIRETPPLAGNPQREKQLFRLIRAAFCQRRKTLANAASAGLGLPKETLNAALGKTDIALNARPEQLTLEAYIRLEENLWPDA